MNDKAAAELVRTVKELVKELKRIRKLIESWDEDPPCGEKDIDEYML